MVSIALPFDDPVKAARRRFVATIFAGSFLLFLVQPMIARMALPRLGGAPAVWNSAMLVYQALLLAGYAYAHWLSRLAVRTQATVHLSALAVAALMLPIGLIAATPPPDANAFLWVPWLLLVSIGPLFLVVSAQAPLMQRWFAMSGGGDPYPLYAASNLGSFSGLIAYPLLVEPLVPVATQSLGWSIAYGALMLLVGWCAFRLPKSAGSTPERAEPAQPIAWRTIAVWIGLAAIPSGLMLSTTLHLTTDIVAMPLLWVVPLGLYLLSFSVAFSADRRLADFFKRIAPIILLIATCGVFTDTTFLPLVFAAFALLNLFTISVFIHSALFDRRPDPAQLTHFYLAISVGGALGGLFCALIAPLIFDWTYEHPLLMIAAAVIVGVTSPFKLMTGFWARSDFAARANRWGFGILLLISLIGQGGFGLSNSRDVALAASFVLIAIALIAIGNRILFALAVGALMLSMGGWEKLSRSAAPGRMTRSFFGVYSIGPFKGDARVLIHGTTIHGIQNRGSPARERMATSYYAPSSGVGLAMAATPQLYGNAARVGVVGLGTGTLACYSQPGQRWKFYEIDPVIVGIARDPAQFTFLSRCQPKAPIIVGDARLTLEREPTSSADILVVDAFSSDSVPMHLLTREAFATYRRHLAPGGLLLVHISNRYLDLEPVIAGAARDGWSARLRLYMPDAEHVALHESGSIWIALSPSAEMLERLVASNPAAWRPLRPRPGFKPWTDEHASILPIIKLGY
jgi:SAM-dependent methyltransferase